MNRLIITKGKTKVKFKLIDTYLQGKKEKFRVVVDLGEYRFNTSLSDAPRFWKRFDKFMTPFNPELKEYCRQEILKAMKE